jgi:hypothetical protein
MDSLTTLIDELKTLRKGRGMSASDIGRRVGPRLRAACEVADGDDSVRIREKVRARLEGLAVTLSPDLRLAVLAGFGLLREAGFPSYTERVEWLAAKSGRDPRTARRRIDDGVRQLAELIAQAVGRREVASSPTGWRTAELSMMVALDRARPEAFEQRRIVADRPGLAEVDLAVTLASNDSGRVPGPDDLEIDVVHGGSLESRGMETSERFAFVLALPRPLEQGESHVFAIQYRFADEQVLRPHVVCVPRHPCDRFELRVRFGSGREPPLVHLLNANFQRDVDDDRTVGEEVPVDRAGDIHVVFRDLSPGLAYGLRWTSRTAGDDPPDGGLS